ncbi:MAG: hypothetical protein ACNYPD_04505 [Candidatus Halichondribacter symbioticus]
MPYIKLLTVLAGLALLTACGGAAKTADNAGKSANPCIENPFGATCSADDSTIISLRQSVCLADTTINPACTGEAGIATVFCKANPFNTSKACVADTGAIRQRQNQCLDNANINLTCGAVIANFCKTNPFQESACLPNDTYLPARIADCITGGKADSGNCGLITLDTAKNTMITACLENPFDVACESVPDFMSSFAEARTNRASFCDDSMNVADDLCTGDNVGIICGTDPFNAICFTGNTYRSPRITNCIMAGNAGDDKCDTIVSDTAMNTELTDCLTNPFATACESLDGFTTYALARTNRLTFCDDSANVANTLCMGESQMGVCGSNPFNASCFTDKTYLPARLTDCITAENTEILKCNTLLSDSTMNTAITACLTNPFTDACASNADFMTYAGDARTNREGFCGMSGNESKDPCTALTACKGNPFGAGCGEYFAPARITDCITVASTEATKCDTITTDAMMNEDITDCLDNPFDITCESVTAFMPNFADARTNRVTFCEANDSNALCISANLTNLCGFNAFSTLCTSGTYLSNRQSQCAMNTSTHTSCPTLLSGLADASDLPTYPALPDTERPVGFLEGTPTGVDTTGFTPVVANTDSLNFTATAGTGDAMVSLNGLATDGVAWARIDFTGDVSDGFYAGILSGTNMGAPLVKPATATGAKVTWKGIIQGTDNTGALDARPFTLNVDLYNRTLKAFVLHPTDAISAFSIDGTYTAEGIISGTTLFGVYMNRDIADQRTLDSNFSFTGTLTGLIGEKGAVAAFHSNTPSNGYSGGFIAKPPE